MRLIPTLALAGAGLLSACSHTQPKIQAGAELKDLERQLAESRGREAELQRKVDELNNRIFLLQDQVDSERVAAYQKAPPRVPVDPRADTRPENEPDPDIEYAGAARDANAPRPILRLSGGQMPPRQGIVEAAPPKEADVAPRAGRSARAEWRPPSTDDKLPVTAAVPPVPVRGDSSAGKTLPRIEAPRRTAPPQVASTSQVAGASHLGEAEPMKMYNAAIELLKHGQHAEAIAGLQKFVRQFPSHDYADNAQYWLGECYYDQKDYKSALREFRRVIQRFPSGNKAPDALLKVGYCYGQLQDSKNERDVLEQVLKSYPGTDVAKKAADKLAELK